MDPKFAPLGLPVPTPWPDLTKLTKYAIYGKLKNGFEFLMCFPKNFGIHPDDRGSILLAEGMFENDAEARAWYNSLDLEELYHMRKEDDRNHPRLPVFRERLRPSPSRKKSS